MACGSKFTAILLVKLHLEESLPFFFPPIPPWIAAVFRHFSAGAPNPTPPLTVLQKWITEVHYHCIAAVLQNQQCCNAVFQCLNHSISCLGDKAPKITKIGPTLNISEQVDFSSGWTCFEKGLWFPPAHLRPAVLHYCSAEVSYPHPMQRSSAAVLQRSSATKLQY